ncbi:hypothetical protein [Streptomyces sp. NPDC101393]
MYDDFDDFTEGCECGAEDATESYPHCCGCGADGSSERPDCICE